MPFRMDNRAADQMRPVRITPDYLAMAEGSALMEVGNTRVICTASIEETVPFFMRNSGKGWITSVAATSVGIIEGEVWLDLPYEEDSRAEVDMNFVMTGSGKFVELQATAEQNPFDEAQLGKLMKLARKGCEELVAKQKEFVKI